ncbi:MAG: hypothetical protein ACI4S4_07460, partial [Candidatus Ornithospirochaeta sp.]
MKRRMLLLTLMFFIALSLLSAEEKYSYYTEGNGVILTSFGIGRKEERLRIEGNVYTPAFFAFIYGLAVAP